MALSSAERQARHRKKVRSETHGLCSCGKEKINWARECISCTRKQYVGEKNLMWRGQKVGYRVLHLWVERHLGKPNFCEYCRDGRLKPRQYQWANKSHRYLRDLNDWIRLCVKCHKKYDRNYKLVELSKKIMTGEIL